MITHPADIALMPSGPEPASPFPDAGMLFVLDGVGRVFDFNLAAAAEFSLQPTDRGRPLLDLIASSSNRERVEREFHYALNLCSTGDARGQAFPLLARRTDDRDPFPVTLRLARDRRDENRGPGQFLATVHAVTTTPASSVIRPLQNLLETLIANTRDGVLIHELRAPGEHVHVLYANDIAADHLGYASLADLLATPAAEVWQKWHIQGENGLVDLAAIPSWLAEQGGLGLETTLSFSRDDDSGIQERCLTVNISVALSETDSQSSLAIFLLHDLTARRRADHDLVRALQKHERATAEITGILGQIADGVIITDTAGNLTFMNTAAKRLYGVDYEEHPEKWTIPGQVFRPDGSLFPLEEQPLARALWSSEVVQDSECRLLREDGAELWLQGAAAPLHDNTGHKIGAVLTLRDITSHRNLVCELERANRIKDDFLTIISHELRTPLTPLVGWVSLLRGQLKSGRELDARLLDQALESLENNIGQQKKIVEELLDAAHLLLGRARFQLSLYPLSALVRDALEMHENRLGAKALTIDFQADSDLPAFEVDIARLEQAISHVLSNAVEFSPVGGTIWISTVQDGSDAVLTVRDEGAGIDPEFLPHIFDSFRQGDSPFTRRHGGLGMGLTVVKAVVEAHNGKIEARSPGVGHGTEIIMRLPLQQVTQS